MHLCYMHYNLSPRSQLGLETAQRRLSGQSTFFKFYSHQNRKVL